MKCNKLALLVLLAFSAGAKAEAIDAYLDGDPQVTIGTAGPACFTLTLIKRNSGGLVTGLVNSKIQNLSVSETKADAGGVTVTSVKLNHTLAKTTSPGVYKLCFTPSNFTWRNGLTDPLYGINGLVRVSATDNGHFTGVIHTHP